MVMRPKSIATVVVVLRSTPEVSSIPTLRSVSCSSVRSGLISLTEPTRVVFPTPNPPATRIFTASGIAAAPREGSERLESIEHFLQKPFIGKTVLCFRPAYHDQPMVQQVPQKDPDDSQGKLELRRDLRHRERAHTEVENGHVLRPGGRRSER